MSAIDNFELALAAQLHEQSQWLLGVSDEASPDQSIRCLGALSVRIKSEPVVMTGRARDVVCALLTRPTAQAPAAVIASELWPHGELDYALGALNTTLYRMRRRNGLSDLIVLRDGYHRGARGEQRSRSDEDQARGSHEQSSCGRSREQHDSPRVPRRDHAGPALRASAPPLSACVPSRFAASSAHADRARPNRRRLGARASGTPRGPLV